MKQINNRRQFLKFLGYTSVMSVAETFFPLQSWAKSKYPFLPLKQNTVDSLQLVEGLKYEIIAKFGDKINQNESFGYDNDFIAFLPINANEGYLWVNHEDAEPLFVHGEKENSKRTKAQVDLERKAVGGSLLELHKVNRQWKIKNSSPHNRRFDGFTKIPFAWGEPIAEERECEGTIANCSGGVTPWGTFLTCEENYQIFVGEVSFKEEKRVHNTESKRNWNQYYNLKPEHYGWVVEIDPKTHSAKKLVAMGRFAHEAATLVQTKNKKLVVYSGDDKADEHIYKFISNKTDSLETGELFVADTLNGKWISLSLEKNPKLRNHFKNQTEVLIRTREAAKIVGATPLDRPEGMDRNPINGDIICALTNNKQKGNHYGSLIRIREKNGDPLSMSFDFETFLAGGPEAGFACPDNVVFDKKGGLWFTTDVSESEINKGPYSSIGNNGLFYVPISGSKAGKAFCIATGPNDSELCSPCFIDNGRTLLLSVQHPGVLSKNLNKLTSQWPDGSGKIPRPSVVAITGQLLEELQS